MWLRSADSSRAIRWRSSWLPARTNVMGPRQILDLLAGGSSLDVLRDGPADLPSRQRDVTTALRWSYQLLDDGEAALLCQLSVFPGWFSVHRRADRRRRGRRTGARTRCRRSSMPISWTPTTDRPRADIACCSRFVSSPAGSWTPTPTRATLPDGDTWSTWRHRDRGGGRVPRSRIVRRAPRVGGCECRHHGRHRRGCGAGGRSHGGPAHARPQRVLAAQGPPPRPAEPDGGGGRDG